MYLCREFAQVGAAQGRSEGAQPSTAACDSTREPVLLAANCSLLLLRPSASSSSR